MSEIEEKKVEEKKLVKIGKMLYFPVTQNLRGYLDVDENNLDNIYIKYQKDKGKHGRFVSIWISEEENKKEE